MRCALFLCALSLQFGSEVSAQPNVNSANNIMPGCHAFLKKIDTETFTAGACYGLVTGIAFGGSAINMCLPSGVTSDQAVHVVVNFITRNAARMHESFRGLAYEALIDAWPCQK